MRLRLKLWVVLLVLTMMAAPAFAQSSGKLSVTVLDVFSAADTVIDVPRADTAYSPVTFLPDWLYGLPLGRIQFYRRIIAAPGVTDTNFTNDTFFVDLQHGIKLDDGTYRWQLWLIDTVLHSDSGYSALVVTPADSSIGPFMRARLIHWDSTEVSTQLAGNTYGKLAEIYIIPW